MYKKHLFLMGMCLLVQVYGTFDAEDKGEIEYSDMYERVHNTSVQIAYLYAPITASPQSYKGLLVFKYFFLNTFINSEMKASTTYQAALVKKLLSIKNRWVWFTKNVSLKDVDAWKQTGVKDLQWYEKHKAYLYVDSLTWNNAPALLEAKRKVEIFEKKYADQIPTISALILVQSFKVAAVIN